MRRPSPILCLVVVLLVALILAPACSESSPLQIMILSGRRAPSATTSPDIQNFKWSVDLQITNRTESAIRLRLHDLLYQPGSGTSHQAEFFRIADVSYAAGDKTGTANFGAYEPVTIGAGELIQLRGVRFEATTDENNGIVTIPLEGRPISESAPVDFLSFPLGEE